MVHIKKWLNESQELLNRLSEFGQPGVCTFKQGDIDGCEEVDYDDSSWKKVMGKGVPIPGISTDSVVVEGEKSELELCDWSMHDGPAAMRKKILLPEYIEGLPTKGTRIYLTLTMLAPLRVYVDGKLVASYKYWGDTRQCELVVTDSYKPGKTHTVVFRTPQSDGDAHLGVYVNYDVVEEAMLHLSTAIEQIKFALRLYDIYKESKMNVALSELNKLLNADDIVKRDWSAINNTLSSIDVVLKPFEEYAKEFKVHLIAHSHIDMNWLWDMEDTIDICIRDFKTICDIMDENPDLCFSQSQAAVYDIVKKHKPELFERVKKKVKEGKWDVTAATWVESDLNISGGETFARQVLLASKYVKDELRSEPSQICWEPDTFGHPATIPNMLTKSGVKYYYHFRCGKGYPIYWWEGTDGSRVLGFCFGPYNNALRPNNIMPVTMKLLNEYGMKTSMFVFGVGDHGGGPTRNDIRIKRYLDKKPVMPTLLFSTTNAFYKSALEEKNDYPVVRGEQNFIFEGCYTTKTKIKKLLRDGEAKLMDAEAIMAYEAAMGHDITEDNAKVIEAWKDVCFNGFHDISCGCNIKAADKYDFKIGEEAINTAKAISAKYMSEIANRQEVSKGRKVLTVFNQLGFVRDDIVEVEIPEDMKEGKLINENGAYVPAQFEDGKLFFIAKSVPPFGCRVFEVLEDKNVESSKIKTRMAYGTNDGSVCLLESDRYVLEVSSRTGTIVTLFDKIEKRDILKKLKGEPEVIYAFKAERSSNMLQMFYEEPHIMSAWIIGNKFEVKNLIQTPLIELVSCGPVKATLKVSRKYNKSSIEQYITIYNSLDRVDFSINIDWKEKGYYKDSIPSMRVGFTTSLQTPEYTYETPMGWIDRKYQGVELPSLRFVNLYENGFGVSLYNDCKHGFSVEGDSVYMSLVRGSYSPDAMPDYGPTNAKYAIRPYSGEKDIPSVIRGAAAFNQPLMAAWSKNLGGSSIKTDSKKAAGILDVSAHNVVVSSIKPSADAQGIVVRFVESSGYNNTDVCVKLKGNFSSVFEVDLKEENLKVLEYNANKVNFEIKAFEVKTLMFKF